MEKRGIAVYGSTGSIGCNTLDVVSKQRNLRLVSICCHSNIGLLRTQIERYNPEYAAVVDESKAEELKRTIGRTKTEIVGGAKAAIGICTLQGIETVVNSTVGISGLVPTMEFIRHEKHVALANKETLVTGGEIVMAEAEKFGVHITPIDSEHSAISQCIVGERTAEVEKIILTASGGPFRTRSKDTMDNVTAAEALNHPTWKMGKRITIDCATLMNKGFEVLEAKWLFRLDIGQIEIVIHPQSIIHSFVQFRDGSIKAQIDIPDMRLPIQYALNYPRRLKNDLPRFDFTKHWNLELEPPDFEKFPCLDLAYNAIHIGGTAPAVLNGADEQAVSMFLDEKIKFMDIPMLVRSALNAHEPIENPTVSQILEADKWARGYVESVHNGI